MYNTFQTRDSPRNEQHGAGVVDNVLQEHGRVQAAPHHHVPRRYLRGTVPARVATRTHRSPRSLYQGMLDPISQYCLTFAFIHVTSIRNDICHV